MDLTNLLSTLTSTASVSAISKSSGAKPSQVSEIIQKAVPVLVNGMAQNASTTAGAKSLAKALDDHSKNDISNVSSFLGGLDLGDGAKILGHILGGQSSTLQSGLAKKTGLSSSQVGGILASVAPMVLSYLGSKKQATNTGSSGLGGLLGSMLGGSSSSGGLSSVISAALADKDGDGTPDLLGSVGGLFGFGKK